MITHRNGPPPEPSLWDRLKHAWLDEPLPGPAVPDPLPLPPKRRVRRSSRRKAIGPAIQAAMRATREARNLSQGDAAAQLGISRSAYGAWERGVATPTTDAARRIRAWLEEPTPAETITAAPPPPQEPTDQLVLIFSNQPPVVVPCTARDYATLVALVQERAAAR